MTAVLNLLCRATLQNDSLTSTEAFESLLFTSALTRCLTLADTRKILDGRLVSSGEQPLGGSLFLGLCCASPQRQNSPCWRVCPDPLHHSHVSRPPWSCHLLAETPPPTSPQNARGWWSIHGFLFVINLRYYLFCSNALIFQANKMGHSQALSLIGKAQPSAIGLVLVHQDHGPK